MHEKTQKNTRKHQETQENTRKHRETRGNTQEHMETHKNTGKHKETQENTEKHRETQGNTGKHRETQGNSRKHTRTQGNTKKHRKTQGKTRKYTKHSETQDEGYTRFTETAHLSFVGFRVWETQGSTGSMVSLEDVLTLVVANQAKCVILRTTHFILRNAAAADLVSP